MFVERRIVTDRLPVHETRAGLTAGALASLRRRHEGSVGVVGLGQLGHA